MLILGDKAINYYNNSHDIKFIDIVYSTEKQKQIIKHKFKLPEEPIFTYGFSQTYKKDNKLYNIYDANKNQLLLVFLKEHRAEDIIIKPASLRLLYMWEDIKSDFINKNINYWENSILTYEYLYNNYFKYTNDILPENRKIETMKLGACVAVTYNTNLIRQTIISEHSYTKKSLLKFFAGYKDPVYPSIIESHKKDGSDIISEELWNNLTFLSKLDAISEKIYLDVTYKYLLNEILFHEVTDKPTIDLFKEIIMGLCVKTRNTWLNRFIKRNYTKILRNLNPNMAGKLYEAIITSQLKPILKNE